MFTRRVLKCLVFFLGATVGILFSFDMSMGQVRFDDAMSIFSNPNGAESPNITAVGDQVFIVLRGDQPRNIGDIVLAHSRNKGMTFRIWNLTRDAGIVNSGYPSVVADGKNIYVGWTTLNRSSERRNWIPYLSRSTNAGKSFHPPFDISGGLTSGNPVMHIQGDVLNVAWAGYMEGDTSPITYIFFARSTDFGETFSEPVIASSTEWGLNSALESALDGDQVAMAWLGRTPERRFYSDVYFTHSADGGKTFSDTINLSEITLETEHTDYPQVAVGRNGYVYAAWVQGIDETPFPLLDVYFARSTDGGKTFDERLNISNNPRASSLGLKMVTAGDNVYLAWYALHGGADDIFFSRSTDGGESFSKPQNISHNPGGSAHVRMSVVEGGHCLENGVREDVVYLVWQGAGPIGNSEIFFSVSLDSGETFSEPENITNNPTFAMGPRIAAVGRNVYIVWIDNVARNWNIFFIRGYLELDSPCPQTRESKVDRLELGRPKWPPCE